MSDQPTALLISTLRDRTDQNRLTWEETGTSDTFQAAFPSHSVQIAEVTHYGSSNPNYVFRIFDSKGEVVEELSGEILGADPRDRAAAQELLKELYTSARRSARGVDQAIRSILEALDDD